MDLIVGLGNPGKNYEDTRHNVGFMVADQLIGDHKATNISKKEFRGELYKTPNFLILKPLTYMNLSGESVQAVVSYYKTEKLVVIHDDLDIAFGAMRFKRGGGSGGHNGLKSIDAHLGNDYLRVRFGIGKPPAGFDTADFVLSRFAKEQTDKLNELVIHASKSALLLLDTPLDRVSSKQSLKVANDS